MKALLKGENPYGWKDWNENNWENKIVTITSIENHGDDYIIIFKELSSKDTFFVPKTSFHPLSFDKYHKLVL